jgi:hypothetical protein
MMLSDRHLDDKIDLEPKGKRILKTNAPASKYQAHLIVEGVLDDL